MGHTSTLDFDRMTEFLKETVRVKPMPNHDERPPPRRKSCGACIKAKRRCDLQRPFCGRCSSKNILCDYGEARSRQRSVEVPSNGDLQSMPLCYEGTIRQPSIASVDSIGATFDMSIDPGLFEQASNYWQPQNPLFSSSWTSALTDSLVGAPYTANQMDQFPTGVGCIRWRRKSADAS